MRRAAARRWDARALEVPGAVRAAHPKFIEPCLATEREAVPRGDQWAIHVFCRTGEIKDRLARHWHDVYMLDLAGKADAALKNKAVAEAVAKHKSWFFVAMPWPCCLATQSGFFPAMSLQLTEV